MSTLGEIMQRILQMQVECRRLEKALAEHRDWEDTPGDHAEFMRRSAEHMAFYLSIMRDTLREEWTAVSARRQASEPGSSSSTGGRGRR